MQLHKNSEIKLRIYDNTVTKGCGTKILVEQFVGLKLYKVVIQLKITINYCPIEEMGVKMKCSRCNKNRATIHIDKFLNGKYIFIDVCDECALKEGMIPQQADITQLLEEAIEKFFVKQVPESGKNPTKEGKRRTTTFFKKTKTQQSKTCSECGITLEEIDSDKLLGCPNDYEIFREEVLARLKRINSIARYDGQLPVMNRVEGNIRLEIRKKKTEMKNAISLENYEVAARIRDEIINLEAKLNEKSN